MAIVLPILSTFNAAGVKAAQGQLATLGNSLKALGAKALGASVGFQALQGAVRFAGDAITEARDLERNMNALNTVFGNLTPQMEAFAKGAAGMGISQNEAARTATFLGSVLKQAGLPMDQVADKTQKLTVLAQDLATTYGYDTSEALTAMTALFRGEYDPIEKFGVALKQQQVNALVAAKGLGHLTGQELLNAQQTVRMEELFRRSADAAGAFARQSGTLFVEQKKLTAVFNNMQAAVGGELTPALAGLMQSLTPLIEESTPKLQQAFGAIGKIIEDLTPIINPLITVIVDIISAFAELVNILEPIIQLLGSTLAVAIELIVDLFSHLGQGLKEIIDWFSTLWGEAEKDYGKSKLMTWFEDFVNQATILKPLLDPILAVINRIAQVTNDANYRRKTAGSGHAGDAGLAKAIAFDKAAASAVTPSGKVTRDAVKEFYAQLKDEMAKQSATFKLGKLGASQAFIESIIGSGADWQKVFASVTAKGKAGVAELQRQFNKTSAGIKEVQDAYEEAKKQAQDTYDEAKKAYDKLKDTYDQQVQAIDDLKKALKDAGASVTPLAVATREIGQFEQAVIDSFNNINETITQGIADGTLLKDAAATLTAYAKSEQTTIQNLMRQRDELVSRRSMAQALMDDIKSAIIGMGNVTDLLAKNTTDVTETITKMVGNVQVATSKVIKGVTGGSVGLVASFTDTLAKTKAFAQQLKDLRALGLDKNIYQQIVSAGVDAGGATAKAILEGGIGTVSELNSLFQELDSVGQSIAEQSAQVMYGAGIDVTDGLINGLLSKEQELVDAATKLANAFTTEFNNKMNVALPMPTAPVAPVLTLPEAPTTTTLRLGDVKLGGYDAATTALATKLIASPKATAWNTTITVNAGVGTNGKAVGQAIYSELLSFAKANGIKV